MLTPPRPSVNRIDDPSSNRHRRRRSNGPIDPTIRIDPGPGATSLPRDREEARPGGTGGLHGDGDATELDGEDDPRGLDDRRMLDDRPLRPREAGAPGRSVLHRGTGDAGLPRLGYPGAQRQGRDGRRGHPVDLPVAGPVRPDHPGRDDRRRPPGPGHPPELRGPGRRSPPRSAGSATSRSLGPCSTGSGRGRGPSNAARRSRPDRAGLTEIPLAGTPSRIRPCSATRSTRATATSRVPRDRTRSPPIPTRARHRAQDRAGRVDPPVTDQRPDLARLDPDEFTDLLAVSSPARRPLPSVVDDDRGDLRGHQRRVRPDRPSDRGGSPA